MTRILVKLGLLGIVLALWGVLWSMTPLDAQISSGSVNAKQSGTWTVQPGNTANTTGWLVTGTGGIFPATQSGTWTMQPGNTANTTAWLVTGTGGTFPATQSGTWTVQPGNTANTTPWLVTQSGNGTFLANQQAVTATAAALATNSTKGFCIKALTANTINVYLGPSTVTTANGDELAPGDGRCYALSNTNLVFVIASTTGASVGWSAWN